MSGSLARRLRLSYLRCPVVGLAIVRNSKPGAAVKYLPPFDQIRRAVEISTVRGELRVSLSYDDFIKIIRLMISGIQVDEEWYLNEYPDIAQAIRDGKVASARQHFIEDGYFEGRRPFRHAGR